MRAKREAWPHTLAGVPAERLVFVDETGANTAMTRTHGRCPKGERLVAAVPAGHWKTTTFVAALRADGMTAPTVVDGPITGAVPCGYVYVDGSSVGGVTEASLKDRRILGEE